MSELYQGDLDLGRLAAARLAEEDFGLEVSVEDFHYGAVAVAQRLQELSPRALVLVAAAKRGRVPGTVDRRRVTLDVSPSEVQRAVAQAVTGYVSIDLIIEVGAGLGALPPRTVAIEVEPARVCPSETLSPVAEAALGEALERVRAEVHRLPLLELTDRLRGRLEDHALEASGALETMKDLLGQLRLLDEDGHWGASFALRDQLRLEMAADETGRGMQTLDWVLWSNLVEELDRLQALESPGRF